MAEEKSTGQVYNVVDQQQVNKKQYMEEFICQLYPRSLCVFVPLNFFSAIVATQEKMAGLLRMKPFLTSYRLASSQNPVLYSASKICADLGWYPFFTFEEAVSRIVAHQQQKG